MQLLELRLGAVLCMLADLNVERYVGYDRDMHCVGTLDEWITVYDG